MDIILHINIFNTTYNLYTKILYSKIKKILTGLIRRPNSGANNNYGNKKYIYLTIFGLVYTIKMRRGKLTAIKFYISYFRQITLSMKVCGMQLKLMEHSATNERDQTEN